MKVAVVTANLGNFEKPFRAIPQTVPYDLVEITDKEFPPRFRSMGARLQARIVKTHMWDFAPGYDVYIWVDSSCEVSRPDSVEWMLGCLDGHDIAVVRHPDRHTIQEEADYLKKRLAMGCSYITPRYENELIDEQLAQVNPEAELYASTVFAMKDSPEVRESMKEWWYHISRYHSIDQLSFPWCIDWLDSIKLTSREPYFTYGRNKA